MNVLMKQWQGAGERFSIVESLERIEKSLDLSFLDFSPDLSESITIEGIRHFEPLLNNLRSLVFHFKKENPKKIFTLAGECSGDVAAVSYLSSVYTNEFVVIWIDAHGDLNTHETSPTSNLHGMPLRLLLGDGHPGFLEQIPCFIAPSQVAFLGTRDLDSEEKHYMAKCNISVWLRTDSQTIQEINRFIKNKKVYIHLDLDVLEPSVHPYAIYKTPGGISVDQLDYILDHVSNMSEIVGISIVEYNDSEGKYLSNVKKLIEKCALLVEELPSDI